METEMELEMEFEMEKEIEMTTQHLYLPIHAIHSIHHSYLSTLSSPLLFASLPIRNPFRREDAAVAVVRRLCGLVVQSGIKMNQYEYKYELMILIVLIVLNGFNDGWQYDTPTSDTSTYSRNEFVPVTFTLSSPLFRSETLSSHLPRDGAAWLCGVVLRRGICIYIYISMSMSLMVLIVLLISMVLMV